MYLVCGNTMCVSTCQVEFIYLPGRVCFRTNSTWQVDTNMVLPQTKYILIPHHAMPQIPVNVYILFLHL